MSRPLYIHLSPMPKVFVEGKGVCTEMSRKSQWFGAPMIPKGVEIPTRLPFLCQIDCREIPQEVTELPHDGELYIFAMLDYYRCGENYPIPMYASEDYLGVVYVPEEKFADATYDIDCHRTLPPERITLNFERPAGDEPDHQLLGEPEHREWEDWDAPFEGWRLLFQMDSCDGGCYHFNFMDWGVFNILIAPEDLKKRDFSKAVGIILST